MTALYSLYLLLFVITYRIRDEARYAKVFPWIKLSTSLCFIAAAILAAYGGDTALLYRMLPGFALAALGDFLLGLATAKRDFRGREFLIGTCSFAAAHIAFYAAFTYLDPPRIVDFLLPIAVTCLVILLSRSKNISLGRMKLPGYMYSYFVGLLFSKALLIFLHRGTSPQTALILSGSALFLVSDLILMFMNFHRKPARCLTFLNLSFYYGGMLLLGLCLFPFA
jgi:uncharacterized membrane protein YhhN